MGVVLQGAAYPVQGVHTLLGFQGFMFPDYLQGGCFLGAQVVQRRLHQGALSHQTFFGQPYGFLGEVLLDAFTLLEEVLSHLQLCTISLNSRAAALDAHNVSAVAAQLLVVVLREHLDLLSNRQVLLQRLVVLRSKFELLSLSLKLQCGQLRRSLLRGPGRLGVSTEHLDLLQQVLTLKFRSRRSLAQQVVVILVYADLTLVVHGFHVRTLSVRDQFERLKVFVVPGTERRRCTRACWVGVGGQAHTCRVAKQFVDLGLLTLNTLSLSPVILLHHTVNIRLHPGVVVPGVAVLFLRSFKLSLMGCDCFDAVRFTAEVFGRQRISPVLKLGYIPGQVVRGSLCCVRGLLGVRVTASIDKCCTLLELGDFLVPLCDIDLTVLNHPVA